MPLTAQKRIPSRLTGFTLLELVIAIAVGGVVIGLAASVYSTVLLGAERIEREGIASAQQANGLRWMRAAFLNADPGSDQHASGFVGDSNSVQFAAWLPGRHGWAERSTVAIGLQNGQLVASGANGTLVVMPSVSRLHLDYLERWGADSPWLSGWASPIGAPLAIRMRIGRAATAAESRAVDTLLFLVGGSR